MNEDLKKIVIIAIAIAAGIFLFRVLFAVLGLVTDILVVVVLVLAGVYLYKKITRGN